MPLNPDLLIAAPILQDSFVEKDGSPMAGGTITCYQDNSRTTLKNWYYQSSNFADAEGNYTFSKLPNPLTLSAAGTICDINGVDTIPFFYPYSELDQTQPQPYYITIVNYDKTNQITRPNFPYNPLENNPDEEGSTDNYIINNVFWRNIGSANLNTVANLTVAPSQHDGFQYPDIQFFKTLAGGQDTLTFVKFPLSNTQVLTGDITPEYYISHNCTNAATGELQKCYQFPISLHVNTLNGVQFTVTIQAQNGGGTGTRENTISLFIFQDTGSGTTPPAPKMIGNKSITLSPVWKKYDITSTFPTTGGLVLSSGGDDALYLQVQMPLDAQCTINFTKPSIYLSNTSPTNSFATYDQIDTVINSPRTGDLRTSLNSFYYFGWVPMNDQTIGNTSSGAVTRANQDTWQLFNLIWSVGKTYDTLIPFNAIAQMYTSAGAATNYGATAIADFVANKRLSLTKMMGQVMMGTVPLPVLDGGTNKQGVTITNDGSGNILVTGTNGNYFFQGQPVAFLTSGNGVFAAAVYYVANFRIGGGGTFNLASSFAAALAGITLVPYVSDGTNTIFTDITGATTGQYSHSQLLTEIPNHTHQPGAGISNFFGQAGAGFSLATPGTQNFASAPTTGGLDPALYPGQVPFNVTQPGTFYNIYIKL